VEPLRSPYNYRCGCSGFVFFKNEYTDYFICYEKSGPVYRYIEGSEKLSQTTSGTASGFGKITSRKINCYISPIIKDNTFDIETMMSKLMKYATFG